MNVNRSVANAATAAKVTSETDAFTPTWDVIALMAYKFWMQRNSPNGSPDDDWFRAECQIKHDRTPGSVI
jgi:hypothetical protein